MYYGDTNIAFDRNVEASELATLFNTDFAWKNLVTDYFRAIHLVSGHQYSRDEDNDPDCEGGIYGVSREDLHGALVFIEFHRDSHAPNYPTDEERYTVVHEVGHCIGPDENDGGIMNSSSTSPWFTALSVSKIRKKQW